MTAALKTAKQPFKFSTRLQLSELTGLKAVSLPELLRFIKEVPGSSIYYHTHRFLQQHHFLSPEPPNDFAYWVTKILGEDVLGERLASIDTIQFHTIRGLREKIALLIEEYLRENTGGQQRVVRQEEAFHFIKSISFVMPTPYVACNMPEFVAILRRITIDSIYYHIFEARLRLEKGSNDFSNWLENALGEKPAAREIGRLDPYTRTLEDLRHTIIKIVEKRMNGS